SASARDLRRVVVDGPFIERGKCRLDFAKSLIDFFGEFIGIRMGVLKLLILRPEGFGRGHLLVAHRDWFTRDVAQAVGVAVRKVAGDLHPFPALTPYGFGVA